MSGLKIFGFQSSRFALALSLLMLGSMLGSTTALAILANSTALVPVKISVTGRHSADQRVDQVEIDHSFEPKFHFDQRDTPTCFAHSATFLLQYLLNSQGLCGDAPRISVIDILAKSHQFRLPSEGQVYVILNKIRGQSVRVEGDFDLSSFWLWKTATSPTSVDVASHLDLLLPENRVELPQYNLHVVDPSSPDLVHILKQWTGSAPAGKEQILVQFVRNWFLQNRMHPVPLSVSYCEPDGDGIESCSIPHSINLVGVRIECNSHSECQDAWRVRGSWGGQQEGWFDARPLARAILMTHLPLTYIKPCAGAACSPGILGLSLESGNSGWATHPLHYLALSQSEDLFFEELKRFDTPEKLKEAVTQKIENSKTLGLMAVVGEATRVITWLAKNYPGILYEEVGVLGNVAHYATNYGYLNSVKALLISLPEIFEKSEKNGFNPADHAALKPDLEMLRLIYKKRPKLLKKKNQFKITPMRNLKMGNPEAYDQFKSSISKWDRMLRFFGWKE